MDVEMPDGTIIEGVPEGMTKSELLRRYSKAQGAEPPKQAKKPEGMLQRMASESSLPDIAFGASQIPAAALQMAAHGAEGLADATGVWSDKAAQFRQWVEDQNKRGRQNYQETFNLGDTGGAAVARGVGQAIATAPMVPAMAAKSALGAIGLGAGTGAGMGALTPVYDVPEGSSFVAEKAKQAGLGAATGGVLAGAGRAAADIVKPALQKGAQNLLDRGVRLTPGQGKGGMIAGIEERAAGYPIVGDVINKARRQSIEDFNRVIYKKALEPFGKEGAAVAGKAKVGNEGIQAVGDFLSDKYDDALARSVPAQVDQSFRAAINKLHTMVPKALRDDFATVINSNVEVTPAGTITPSVLKRADSEIGRKASNYMGSADAAQREFAGALRQAQTELRQLMARYNPDTATQIRAADAGWRTLAQMEKAGGSLGAKDGVFTPAQFLNAVKASDKSVRDRMFSRGEAWNQALAQDAKRVLPQTVPDSGTAGRGAALMALLNPVTAAKATAAAAPVGLLYAPGSSALFRAMATKRPPGAEQAAELLRATSPYLGLLGGISSNQ